MTAGAVEPSQAGLCFVLLDAGAGEEVAATLASALRDALREAMRPGRPVDILALTWPRATRTDAKPVLPSELTTADHVWVLEAPPPDTTRPGATREDRPSPDGHLIAAGVSWSRLRVGSMSGRADDTVLNRALDTVAPHLRGRLGLGSGLFTRLHERQAAQAAWRWACEDCDDPDCEHALRAASGGA